jgi:TRAP-type uncharacterized transport system substrate-binding protein
MVLEVASELVGVEDWACRQAQVSLREQGDREWRFHLSGSDTPDAIHEVASGQVHVAIINPAAPLALALRGTGPFQSPIDVRAITVIPSPDQLAFAVTEKTGIRSLGDIRDRRYPLRVSLRGQRNHSLQLIVREVLSAVGLSLDDIVSWGGTVRYDAGLPGGPNRIGAVERGEIDAIFDEAVSSWSDPALALGMRILPLEEDLLQRLETIGLRRALLTKAKCSKLVQDVPTIDFSGWPVFTHARVPDEVVTSFCAALDARRDRIPWQGEGPLPLERMCFDTPEGPLDIPLHPAAERFWRARGYLPGSN